MIHEFQFQRERVVDINAAVVGISHSRWTKLSPNDASTERAQKIMKDNGFDVLPIDDGWRVREYFRTQKWGDYSSVAQKPITYRDVISYQTPLRDVIKSFATDNRYFYFLGSESRIVGLVTVANLNCRQVQIYLYSLFCELETALASHLSSVMLQDEIRRTFSKSNSGKVNEVETRYVTDREKGVDASYVEYLYFPDLIRLIDEKQWAQLGISSVRQTALKELKDLRNKAAHPVQSLIRNPAEVEGLWRNLELIEEVLFQLRHSLEIKR